MKLFSIDRTILFGLVVTLLFVPSTVFGQSEKLGAVQYTPVKGWKKTAKDNIVSFSELNEGTGKFCIITLYGATPSTGKPEGDFVRDWNERVVKTLAAQGAPKTETEAADGWTMIAGGTAVDYQGTKAFVFLSVFSGYGKTVSILGLLNDEAYLPKVVAFNTSIEVDKAVAAAPSTTAPPQLQYDNNGHLLIPPPARQLTRADLAGQWGESDGINVRYVYRDSGNYAGTDSLHYKSKMTFTADGGYYNDFYAIQNGKMIKDKSAGTISVTGRVLSIRTGNTAKYVIRGWLELPDMTVLEVCGPWYDDDVIPAEIFTNPAQGANLNKKWSRKK